MKNLDEIDVNKLIEKAKTITLEINHELFEKFMNILRQEAKEELSANWQGINNEKLLEMYMIAYCQVDEEDTGTIIDRNTFESVKEWIEDALLIEGEHYKQYYLKLIYERLGFSYDQFIKELLENDEEIPEEGMQP